MTKLEKVDLKRGESYLQKTLSAELIIPGCKSARIFPDTTDGQCTLYARLSPALMRIKSMDHGPRNDNGYYKKSEFREGNLWKDDYWGTNIRVEVPCDFAAVYRDSLALIAFINYVTDEYWLVTHHNMKIDNRGEMIVKWLNLLNETTEHLIPTI